MLASPVYSLVSHLPAHAYVCMYVYTHAHVHMLKLEQRVCFDKLFVENRILDTLKHSCTRMHAHIHTFAAEQRAARVL